MARKKKKTVSTEIRSDTLSASEEKATIFNDKSPSGLFRKNKPLQNIKNKKQDKTIATASTTTGIPRMPFWAFIPVMAMVGFVPLIMRLKILEVSPEAASVWPQVDPITGKSIVYDFFSYYKSLWIMGLTFVMIIMFFILFKKEYIKRGKAAMVFYAAAAVFLIFSLISTLMSQYPETSWWGAPDRREGMVITACYVIMMLYSMYIFNDVKDFKYFVYPLAFLTICSTIIGGFQFFKHDLVNTSFGQNLILGSEYAHLRGRISPSMPPGQIYATFFNPNYVGSFGALVVPLFAGLALLGENWKQRAGYGVLALCGLFLTLGSRSMGGLVASFIALFLLVILNYKRLLNHKKGTLIGIIAVVILLLISNNVSDGAILDKLAVTKNRLVNIISLEKTSYKDSLFTKSISNSGNKILFELREHKITFQKKNGKWEFINEKGEEYIFEEKNGFYSSAVPELQGFSYQVKGTSNSTHYMYTLFYKKHNLYDNLPFCYIIADSQGEKTLLTDDRGKIVSYEEAPSIDVHGLEKAFTGRIYIWSRTLPLVKLIGHGPDTFLETFPQSDLLAKWYGLGNPFIIVDKSHNAFIMYLANNGIIAFIGLLFIIGIGILSPFLEKKNRDRNLCSLVMFPALIGYIIVWMFNDSVVSIAPLYWIALGISLASTGSFLFRQEASS